MNSETQSLLATSIYVKGETLFGKENIMDIIIPALYWCDGRNNVSRNKRIDRC